MIWPASKHVYMIQFRECLVPRAHVQINDYMRQQDFVNIYYNWSRRPGFGPAKFSFILNLIVICDIKEEN